MGHIVPVFPPLAKMRHSDLSITVRLCTVCLRGSRKKEVNANSDGFTSLDLGLSFDLNPDSIHHIWDNYMRGDCVDVWMCGETGGWGVQGADVKTSIQDVGLGCN